MPTWAVEEQSISTAGLEGQITSINLRVSPSDASQMIMELAGDPGHTITLHRNGAIIAITKNEPPKEEPPAPEPVAASAPEEEEHHSRGRRR